MASLFSHRFPVKLLIVFCCLLFTFSFFAHVIKGNPLGDYSTFRETNDAAVDVGATAATLSDTQITTVSVELMVDYILGRGGLSKQQIELADRNDDNGISVADIILILLRPKPVIISLPPTTTNEGELYLYDVQAIGGAQGDTLLYEILSAPPNMFIDKLSGSLSWVPAKDDVGTHTVSIVVKDLFNESAEQIFQLGVYDPNDPPVITSNPASTQATELAPYTYPVTASDPDGDAVSFSLMKSPAGMAIGAGSGLVEWTPAPGQAGTYNVWIRAEDGKGGVDIQTFVIDCTDVNAPPVITSVPPTDALTSTVYVYQVEATDPDVGDALTYLLEISPAKMEINPATGLIRWAVPPDATGDHLVKITVTDRGGNTAIQQYNLKVSVYNHPPVIISVPQLSVIAGKAYSYDVDATDADNDAITYSLTTKPTGMQIDSGTGLITWTPGTGQIGNHNVTVRAEDPKGGKGTQSYELSVYAAGERPYVTSVMPDDGTTNVITNENTIAFTFSKPINPDSVPDNFLVYYKDWETTAAIPMLTQLSPDWRTLTLTVSPEFRYTPPKMWSTHVQEACEPGYFPGSFAKEGVPKTTITANLLNGITDLEGNPLVPFTSGFEMFNRFIWTGEYGNHLELSPNGKLLAMHYGVTAGRSGLIVINANWQSPDGHKPLHTFKTTINHYGPGVGRFTPDSKMYYACGKNLKDQNIHLFDMETFTELPGIPCPDIRPNIETPLQFLPTKNWKKAYVFYNCADAYHTGLHLDLLDIDPTSTTYHDWITTDVIGPFQGALRTFFTMLPDSKRLYLSNNVPGVPGDPFYFWGVVDIDPQSHTCHEVTYWREMQSWLDNYNPNYQITPNGKWLYGSPASWGSCGGCGYFARKLILENDPAKWNVDKVWANSIGYGGYDQIGCAPDSRTIYWATYSHYVLVFDIDEGTYIDADANPLTTTPKIPGTSGSYTDFPEGISLIPVQNYEWWPGKIWHNVAAACLVPPHNKFFYFSGASLIVEVIPTVRHPKSVAPEIEILSPPDGATVGESQITVVGAVNDNRGVSSVKINGKTAQIQGGLFWGECSLSEGTNQIVAVALDTDGNPATDTVSIIYDPAAPVIAFTAPENHSHTRSSPVVITGTVSDPTVTSVKMNGFAIPVSGGTFMLQQPLAEGANLFYATATNGAGKTGSASIVVHYEYNESPTITSVPPLSAEVGTPYSYQVTAEDPNGDTLTYSLLNAPKGMRIDSATGLVEWTPTGFDEGQVSVIIQVADGWGGSALQKFYITIIPAGSDITPPRVTILPETLVPAYGDTLNVVVDAIDDVGVTTRTLSVNGSPVPVLYDVHSQKWQAQIKTSVYGENVLYATAKDASGNTGDDTLSIYVYASDDHNPPNVKILKPESGTELTSKTAVWGVVGDNHLVSWTLEYSPKGEDAFATLTGGTEMQIIKILYELCPENFLPGTYILRLRAQDINFLTASTEIEFTVKEPLTVGFNEFRATDLSVPMMGLNLEVARSYNSFDKTTGDFGVGWRMSGVGIQITKSSHGDVIIRKPDGTTVFFMGDLEQVNPFYPRYVRVSYIPFGSTFDELDFAGENILFLGDEGELLTWPDFKEFAPETWYLTTPDGRKFTISAPSGAPARILSVSDRNGNVLTFQSDGIFHSAGLSITYIRDAEGRITQITDPMGKTVHYAYDAAGDLVSVTNRRGFTSTYTYDSNHNLLSTTDPTGVGYTYEYDTEGRVVALIDGEGNRTELEYKTGERQEIVRDANGNPEILTYDEHGHVIARTNALGQTTRTKYNDHGLPIRIIDPDGNVTTQTWDGSGNLLTKTDPLGNTTTYTYNEFNQRTSVTDPLGNKTIYGYDSKGNRTSITDPAGGVTSFQYDTGGNLIKNTDQLGRVTNYKYDSFGGKTVEDPPGPARTEMTYDDNGRLITRTSFRTVEGATLKETTRYEYDAEGNLTRTISPDGTTQENTYDEAGRLSGIADPEGRKSDYNRDGRGLITKAQHRSGRTFDFDYDHNGHLTELGSSMGVSVGAELDKLGRTTKINNPDGTYRTYEYNKLGKVIRETDERGDTTLYAYDTNGHLTCTTDTLGNATYREYDAAGNLAKVTDPNGNTTEYEYDPRNLNTLIRYPDGTTKKFTYDTAGQKTSETDQAENTTYYEYDEASNLIKVTDALGNKTRYTRDENRNITSVTDANDNTTSFTYDSHNRRISTLLPDGKTETRTYNNVGNPISKSDFNGHTTIYEYNDDFDLLIKTTYHDGTEEIRTYDGQNRLKTLTNTSGTLTFAYDSMSRITSVTDTFGQTVSYTYDEAGNRKTVQTPFGTTTYNYNAINRLVELIDHSGAATDFNYDAAGNLLKILRSNGANADFNYDHLNRLLGITHIKDSDIIASFNYTLGPAGNRTRVVEHNGRTVDYTYDTTYKLTGEAIQDSVSGSRTIAYTYDAAGNRLTKTDGGTLTTYTYDAHNRLVLEERNSAGSIAGGINTGVASGSLINWDFRFSVFARYVLKTVIILGFAGLLFLAAFFLPGEHRRKRQFRLRIITLSLLLFIAPMFIIGPESLYAFSIEAMAPPPPKGARQQTITYSYDDNGNLTDVNAPSGKTTLKYDPANRLVAIISPTKKIGYAYDAQGNRILRKTEGEDAKRYLLDRNTGPGGIKHAQVLAEMNASNGLKALMTRAFEELLRFDRAGKTYHPLTDGTLSTRLLTDSTGAATDTYIYEAFGALLNRTGTTENDFLFTGQQYDPNAGFYYLRARYYDPSTARFLTPDPKPFEIYDPATLHRYTYSFNNPVNYYDPSGEVGTLQEAVISSAIIGGLTSALIKIITTKKKGWAMVKEVLLAAALGAAFGAISGGFGNVATWMAGNVAWSWPAWKLSGRAIIGIGYASFIIVPLAYADVRIWGGGTSKQVAITLVLAWIVGFITFMAGAAADFKMQNMIVDKSIELTSQLPRYVLPVVTDVEGWAINVLTDVSREFKILSNAGTVMDIFSPFVQAVIEYALQ